MRNLRLTKDTASPRRLLWAAAFGVAAVASALVPAQPAARPQHDAGPAHARLEHGTLRVRGSEENDAIALRLAPGDSTVVQVDLGDDGSADFSFPRAQIERITVEGRRGD